jgi:hypothetical protein
VRDDNTRTHEGTHTQRGACIKYTFFPLLRQFDKAQCYWPCRKRNEMRQEVQRAGQSPVRLLTLFCVTRQLIHLSDHLFFIIYVIMFEDQLRIYSETSTLSFQD